MPHKQILSRVRGFKTEDLILNFDRIRSASTDFIRGNPITTTAIALGVPLSFLGIAAVGRRVAKRRKAKRKAKKRGKKRKVSRKRRAKRTHASPRHRGHKRVSFTTKDGKRVSFLVKKKAKRHKHK